MISFFPTGHNRPLINNLSGSERLKNAGMLFFLWPVWRSSSALCVFWQFLQDSRGTFGSRFHLIGARGKIFSGHPCSEILCLPMSQHLGNGSRFPVQLRQDFANTSLDKLLLLIRTLYRADRSLVFQPQVCLVYCNLLRQGFFNWGHQSC